MRLLKHSQHRAPTQTIQVNYTLKKNAGLFNPILGQIWTNSNIELKM